MREACRLAARAMAEVAAHVAPGVTTDELDRIGHEYLLDHGAYPSTLGYRGFPKSLCTSVNEVICHGIPDSTVLADGDIVNIDITAFLVVDGLGVHGDTDATYLVGEVDEESRLLVERTHEAMMRGIKAVAPGRQINVVGPRHRGLREALRLRRRPRLHRSRHRHGLPLRADRPALRRRPELRHGHRAGHDLHRRADAHARVPHEWEMWADGWTVVTKDRRRSAQFEHTVLVTDTRRGDPHPALTRLGRTGQAGRHS